MVEHQWWKTNGGMEVAEQTSHGETIVVEQLR